MDTIRLRFLPSWTKAQSLTLTGCAMTQVAGTTTITTMALGMFLLPVSSSFGWPRDVLPTAYGVLTLSLALATPLLGRLIDRYDPRLVLGVGSGLFAATTASLAFLSSSRPLLFALYAIWGFTSSALTAFGYTKIVAAWFDLDRGLAMGLMLLGTAIGSMIIPVMAETMIQTLGWRVAYVGLGAVVFLVSVPAIFGLIKRTSTLQSGQSARTVAVSSDKAQEAGGTSARQAMRSYKFWFVVAAMFLVGNVVVGLQVNLFPLLRGRGLSITAATAAVTLSGVAMIAGRLIGGAAMDRFAKEKVASVFFIGPIGVIAALCVSSGVASAMIAASILGLCAAAEVAVGSVLVADLFGLHAYGQIFSWVFAGWVAGCGMGPWLLARSFVVFGSYRPGLWLLAVFAFTASALTYVLGRGPGGRATSASGSVMS